MLPSARMAAPLYAHPYRVQRAEALLMCRFPLLPGLLAFGLALLPPAAGLASPSAPAASAAAPPVSALQLHEYPPADLSVDGFPVWLGADRKLDRVAVLVEGFDLFNRMDARGVMRMIAPVAVRLGALGFDALVVDFPDSHLAPDQLAPHLDRAIRAAAKAAGQPVAVVGLSAGGITARWALAAAEERGETLPVHTLLLLDSPNRGARLNPGLQAMVCRYGGDGEREALTCPAARALLACVPGEVQWKRIGPPGARRQVPVRCTPDSSGYAAFARRLQALNGNHGYPRGCRVVAVAQGSWQQAPADGCSSGTQERPELFRLWLPLGAGWVQKGDCADTAPGSLLPSKMAERFRVRFPLGIAGSYLRTVPTFVPTESALDAAAGEKPPFDTHYVRPDGLPPIAHDDVDPGALDFVVRTLVAAFPEQLREAR